jgi:hypothetical protein
MTNNQEKLIEKIASVVEFDKTTNSNTDLNLKEIENLMMLIPHPYITYIVIANLEGEKIAEIGTASFKVNKGEVEDRVITFIKKHLYTSAIQIMLTKKNLEAFLILCDGLIDNAVIVEKPDVIYLIALQNLQMTVLDEGFSIVHDAYTYIAKIYKDTFYVKKEEDTTEKKTI